MSKDVGDVIGEAIGRAAREALQSISPDGHKSQGRLSGLKSDLLKSDLLSGHIPFAKGDNPLSGGRGVAAGAGLATLAPLAYKGASKLMGRGGGDGPVAKAKEKAKEKAGGEVKEGIKDAAKEKLPGGNKGQPGVGKGRRMPVQQAVDVSVPLATAYNQWTQFEEWPNFMHRITDVSQEDEAHISFKTKIWGKTKEFKAEIVEQRPDERIKWEVTEGVSHTGVVTFHQLADRLTRIEVNIDVQPGSLIEKAARGMRHVKRAVRADLARFKAYTVMQEEESGEWRGTIEDGEVKSTPSRSASATSGEEGQSRSASGGRSQSRSKPESGGRSRSASSSGGRSRSASSSGGGRSRSASSSGGGRSRSSSSRSKGSSASSKSRSSSNGKSSNAKSSGAKSSGASRTRSGSGSSRSSRAKSGSRS